MGNINGSPHGFVSRKMPPKVVSGKVVDITYSEVNSQLKLVDSLGAISADSPILLSSERNVRETIEHHK